MARQAEATNALRLYIYTGLAAGLAVLCKYSGAFLVGGLGLWIALSQQGRERWHRLAAFLLPAFGVAAPLIYDQFNTDFYLPQTLSTLSRIDDLDHPLSRLLFFAVSPLFFMSPLLLFLLYAGLGAGDQTARPPRPAPRTLHHRRFFCSSRLSRGQIKGNWILPGLLSLWPVAFVAQPRRWLLVAVVVTGLLQALVIGLGLKYPGLYSDLAARSGLGHKLCWLGAGGRPGPRAFLLVERAALRVQRLASLRCGRGGGFATAAAAEHAVQHTVCAGVLRKGRAGVLHG